MKVNRGHLSATNVLTAKLKRDATHQVVLKDPDEERMAFNAARRHRYATDPAFRAICRKAGKKYDDKVYPTEKRQGQFATARKKYQETNRPEINRKRMLSYYQKKAEAEALKPTFTIVDGIMVQTSL